VKRLIFHKIIKSNSKNGPTPFFIIFAVLFFLEMFSYPLNIVMPDGLFAFIEDITGPYFIKLAYFAGVTTLFFLLVGYLFTPCRRWARQFQLKSIEKCNDVIAIKLWVLTCCAVLILCFVAYVRIGFAVPLILARNMNELDYTLLRFQTGELIGAEIIVLCQYIFLPLNTLTVFGIATKQHVWLRICTIALYLLVGLFTLERSTLVIPVLVFFVARMSLKPIPWTLLLRPFVICLFILVCMIAFSLTERVTNLETLIPVFIGRLIHGQWIGLPLYLWYYQDKTIELGAVIHPYLKSFFDLQDVITPGTALMMEIYPKTISAGVVGNIPTFFIGEAYAIGGWPMVGTALIHVILFLSICAWMFTQLPKTPITCLLYGIIIVKITMGLVLGYSMFLFSFLTFLVLIILLSIFIRQSIIHHIPNCLKKETL
jgi:hypothetical protein